MKFAFSPTPWLCATLFALAAGSVQAGPTLERIKSSGTITLGYRAGGAPFSYEKGGEVIGYSIDVCRSVAQAIQQQLQLPKLDIRYQPVTTGQRVDQIQKGTIDIECAGSTNTKARREQVAFGLTYFYAGARLLVREGSGIQSLNDLKGKKVVLIKGTTAQQVVEMRQRQGSVDWNVQVMDSTRAGAEAVQQGKADAVVQDDVQLVPLARQLGKPLTVVGTPLTVEPLSLMFDKTDSELRTMVVNEMSRLYREGEINRIYDRWFRSPLPGHAYNLDMDVNPLLRDNFRRPSTYVADWVVL
ncbi:MAG: amino acid ABC transporter substrate-binding protein [Pseudomonadota bacterium]|nr:amino acid ABC transporter substrate-binding protein [Pseudomonadota bacterium]